MQVVLSIVKIARQPSKHAATFLCIKPIHVSDKIF
jgi:hypothetical protein